MALTERDRLVLEAARNNDKNNIQTPVNQSVARAVNRDAQVLSRAREADRNNQTILPTYRTNRLKSAADIGGVSKSGFSAAKAQLLSGTDYEEPTTLDRIKNLGTAVGGAVLQGADAAATGISSTLDFLVGRPLQALGWEDNWISQLNNKLQSEREANAEYFNERLDNDRAAQTVLDLGTAVSRAAWELPLIVMTGGASKAVQGTTKGLQATAALESTLQSSGIGQTVTNAVNLLQRQLRNPQTWQSFASTTGQAYDDAKTQGASEASATAYAVINGLLGSLVEVGGGGIQELPDVLRQPSRLRNWIDTMLDEGKEEVVQGVIDRLTQNVTGVANNPIVGSQDENAVFNLGTALEEFGGGALVGGILGGGQIGVDAALNRIRGNASQSAAEVPTTGTTPQAGVDTSTGVNPAEAGIDDSVRLLNEGGGVIDESTAVNTNPAEHTPAEQKVIEDYQNAVDENLVQFVNDAVSNRGANNGRYELSPVSDRAANDIQRITGVDTHGNRTVIEQRIAEHIYNEHGPNGTTDHSMRDLNDIGRIQWVLDNYDDAVDGGTSRAYRTNRANGRQGPSRTVIFSKAVNGTYYVVEATPDTRSRTNFVVSAYMNNKKPTDAKTADAETPAFTADTDSMQPVGNSPTPTNAADAETPAYTADTGGSPPVGTSSIPDSGQNVNALADSMTDEQLAAAQQVNDADIASIYDVLNAAEGGQQIPQEFLDEMTAALPSYRQEQQRLAGVEQAKRVQRGEVSRGFAQPENHIDNRTPDSVKGNRVAAFSFDHPQLHGYFVQAAQDLQAMADYAAEAERGRSNRGNRIERERNRSAVEHAYSRELRNAMESGDLSKPQVLDACQRIIDNHGQENVLAAKRIELILDDMLTNGYTTADGTEVPPNMEYIAAKEQISGARGEERAIERYEDDLAIAELAAPFTDAELAEQEVERQRIRDQYAAMRGQGVQPTDSTGAAPAGFDRFSAAIEQYGEMPERGTGAREVSIPRAMNDNTVVPQTVQTFANAEATPETTYTDITRILEHGGFNRAVITDRASLGRAEQTITDKGFQQALIDWTATVRSGRVSKDTTTLGLALYNNAINSGDTQAGIQILTDIVDNARTAAQATQAMSILNKLTPEGRLHGVQRSISNLQDELSNKYGDLAPDLHIDESLAGDYLNATDEQTRFEILDQIYQDIANQIPQNWYDKLNAWRYFAMLANPRTHVRNILGNSAMAGLTSIRNRISSGLQRRFVSDPNQRTRETISRRNNAEDAARYQVGMQEYQRISDMLGDAGKYTNELNRIRRHMRAPFNGLLGKAMNLASDTLEIEDVFFSQKAYASNLAQFLRARGITAEDYVSGNAGQEVIAEAQAYAIREAQRLTFRDFNSFSNFVQRIANLGGDSGVGRAWQTIVGANMPFTRTPANIVVRGIDYSPIGLMRGLFNLGVNVKRGNMTAGEAIDQISSGLVGTALVGLGALLASQGYITGGGSDDDEQAAFDELRGFQPYALQIGGKSYTLDWLAPAALPFFTGAEIWNQLAGRGSEDGETNALEAVLQGIGHMTDPMLEMSMLSGISDLLDSVAYYQGSNSLWPVLSTSVTNYISQFFPSVLGAIERTIEDRRQSSYTDPTSIIPDDLQYPIAQAMNRLPGEYNQVDYIDAWGRTESTGNLVGRLASNFVTPGYYSELSTSEVEDELQRVYDATGGEYNVFPDRATMGNTTINGERLTPEQYTEYATMLGQTRLAEVSALMDTDAYKAMSDTEKARAIQEVYDYALQTAKHSIDPTYKVDSRYEKAAEYGDIAEYLAFDRAWASVNDSKGADTAAFEAVMQDYERMNAQQQAALMEALGDGTRFDDVVNAYEAGIEPERWYDAYDEWRAIDGGDASATDKATQFAQWLETEGGYNEDESNLLQDQLAYFSMIRGNAERYDELRSLGFDPQESYSLYEAIGEMNTLKADKDENGESISGSKKAKVIAAIDALNLTPAEKDILFNEFTTYTGLEDTPWH